MTALTATRSPSHAARLSLWGIVSAVAEKIRERRGLRTMLELDDHLLRDIGVTRGDVAYAAQLPLTWNASAELLNLSTRANCGQ